MTTVQTKVAFEGIVITNHSTAWLKPYSKFTNGKEFNDHWEMIMCNCKREFTALQHKILNRIRKFAWTVAGVANASYSYYMEQLERELGHSISVDTIRRTIEKAERYGILKRYKSRRLRNTSQSANVIIFNRYEETEVYTENIGEVLTDELKARLQQEYEAHQERERFIKQKHEDKKRLAAQQKAIQKQNEQEQAMKQQSLYARIKTHLANKKMDMSGLKQYAAIIFGSIKKAMAADNKLTKEQAEQIAWESFLEMSSKDDKEIKKNRFAILSAATKRKFDIFTNGYKMDEIKRKQGVRTEVVPEWFNKRNEDTELLSEKEQAEARANLAAKMGW